jgi:trans-aconitate methyltransferase
MRQRLPPPSTLKNIMQRKLDEHVAAYQDSNIYYFDNKILLTWYPQRILAHSNGATSLLELGLGHGYTSSIFSTSFSRHQVLEGSAAVIQNFRENFPDCRAEIIETFFETFSTDEKFDLIVMGFILEHVDDPLEIISRYKQFLAPDGKMFVAVPNAEALNRRLGHLAGMLPDMEALSENDFLLGHKRYYSARSLTRDVEQAGCRVDKLEGIYLKPFTSSQMISLNLPDSIVQALCEVGIDYPELSCGILAQISTS